MQGHAEQLHRFVLKLLAVFKINTFMILYQLKLKQ